MQGLKVSDDPQLARTGQAGQLRVLIVRPSALGDVSRTVPALVSLRRAMPRAHIDWLVNDSFADVVRHHRALDGVIRFPRGRFSGFYRDGRVAAEVLAWARKLRASRYDIVFDLQGLLRSGLFTWLTRAPERIGFADARELGWLGYNRRHRVALGLHTVDRMLSLIEAQGYPPHRDMHLYLGSQENQWLEDWLKTHGVLAGSYACIAPTARWLCKCWPMDRYAQIATRLLQSGIAGDRLVILSSPQERGQVQPLLDALGQQHNRVLFPQTSVGQMMAILSRASILVCNDSAPLHIAVGFNRPIVSIFGPTDPAIVGPYGRPDAVVRSPAGTGITKLNYRNNPNDQSIISQVPTEMVWDKVLEQLSQSDG